jgi:hypothetical protein
MQPLQPQLLMYRFRNFDKVRNFSAQQARFDIRWY